MITPTHYTDCEGGLIHPWTGGPVPTDKLSHRAGLWLNINGYKVHALFIGHPAEVKQFSRWDCVNGWTDNEPKEKPVGQDNGMDRVECPACGPSARSPGALVEIQPGWPATDPHCAKCGQPIDAGHPWPPIILETCEVLADRQDQYGDPENSFALIAGYWSAYTQHHITATDVAHMMALFKIARLAVTSKRDNYKDAIGYLVHAADRLT